MSDPKKPAAGVLPSCNGTDARYMVLSCNSSLTIPEWEELGRPTWSVRWLSPIDLPGGGVSAEELYAQTGIPCYLPPIVAGTPPFGASGVEIGYETPGGSDWMHPTVELVRNADAARTLVKDVAAKGGRYCTWDRSVTGLDHQRYLSDGEEPFLVKRPVTPDMSYKAAAEPEQEQEHDPAKDMTRMDIPLPARVTGKARTVAPKRKRKAA